MTNRKFVVLALILALSLFAGWAGGDIAFSKQWPFFEALRTSASIVLGIMGAWVSILYPKALERVINKSEPSETNEQRARIDALLLPIKLSTMVLVAVLLIGPLSLAASNIEWVVDHVAIVRGLAFGTLVFLTLAEMAAVVLTIWPVQAARGDLDSVQRQRIQIDNMFTLADRRKG